MKAILPYLLVLLVSLTVQTTTSASQDLCPPWFINSSSGCVCDRQSGQREVMCDSTSTLLYFGYCMTYNSVNGLSELGKCPYIAKYTISDYVYLQLPDNVSNLNEFMCGPLNREGTLCEKCKDGHGIALYSYTLQCIKCWGHGYGWALYYFLELFPITVLYFLVLIFHIRATSSPMSALVLISQIMVYTIRLNIPLHMYIENKVNGFPYVVLNVLLVLCGIWSLDFFRFVIPPFCVSSNIKTVHALALEYVVAFYPVYLILVTFAFIKLHDNNFRLIVWVWRPFHRHFVHFRRRWDSKASIINTFTTFLLLAFSKILFVSFSLLYNINIRYHPHIKGKCVLYYDPTVECSSKENILFGVLALFVLTIFIFSPTILLILYPTRLFRRCVSCCRFRRWHALHMFVESFQGEYKDGANGTWDLRMASSSFLILRILLVGTFVTGHYYQGPLMSLQCILIICALCFHAVLKPYRDNYRNNTDILTLSLLGILTIVFLHVLYHSGKASLEHLIISLTLLLGIPHMVLISYILYKLAKKAGITECLKRKYTYLKTHMLTNRCADQNEPDVEAEDGIESPLPDRLIHPEEYEPLLNHAQEHTNGDRRENTESIDEEPRNLLPVYTYGSVN